MVRRLASVLALSCAVFAATVHAGDVTPLEMRWLKGIWPVVTHAREIGLPLDLVVQPQDSPGAAPLALGFVGDRCKLVLSMRGNPEGERQINAIRPELLNATLELMAAHELGHCRRYLDGAWYGAPAGFVAAQAPSGLTPELQKAWLDMRMTRREEAYGDLVGLAWTQARHPELYRTLHAWLVSERSADLIPGSHHDTLDWLALVKESATLEGQSIFNAATSVWTRGLKD